MNYFMYYFLDKTEPLVSVGSVLTKDTSMDGERMTVSDEESIVGTDSRIASTGAAELKVNIFIYKYLDLYFIFSCKKQSKKNRLQQMIQWMSQL